MRTKDYRSLHITESSCLKVIITFFPNALGPYTIDHPHLLGIALIIFTHSCWLKCVWYHLSIIPCLFFYYTIGFWKLLISIILIFMGKGGEIVVTFWRAFLCKECIRGNVQEWMQRENGKIIKATFEFPFAANFAQRIRLEKIIHNLFVLFKKLHYVFHISNTWFFPRIKLL